MLTRQQLKENAKARLKGNWWTFIGMILIVGFITGAVNQVITSIAGAGGMNAMMTTMMDDMMNSNFDADNIMRYYMMFFTRMQSSMALIQVLTWVIAIFVTGPLQYGIQRGFYRMARGFKPEIGDAFYFFKNGTRYKGIIGFYFNLMIRQWGWSVLIVTVPMVVMFISAFTQNIGMLMISMFLIIAAMFVLPYILTRYGIAFVQHNDYEGITSSESIKRSLEGTKPYRGEIFTMQLSFIGWIFLAMACLFIPIMLMAMEYLVAGVLLFIVGIIGFIIIIYYTEIYMYAALMEQACAISDVAYGNPYANMQFDPFGNPMPPQSPMGGQQGFGGQIPMQPMQPPMGQNYPPQMPMQPQQPAGQNFAPPQQPMQPPVQQNIVPPQAPVVEPQPQVEPVAPTVMPDFTVNPTPAPELDYKSGEVKKEQPIHDAQVPEAPEPPSTDDFFKNK